ncbi:hypothetical protein Glove_349g112 [Diversispora epigaea]|uniref:Uncharacterized protein n=1 Tax=Diversispora epigaea TaxID=1348612 RepID=A0A397HGR0_9GLOM|nr:hypothetical protein Glove_349g112 [Diversispora epigaea]
MVHFLMSYHSQTVNTSLRVYRVIIFQVELFHDFYPILIHNLYLEIAAYSSGMSFFAALYTVPNPSSNI